MLYFLTEINVVPFLKMYNQLLNRFKRCQHSYFRTVLPKIPLFSKLNTNEPYEQKSHCIYLDKLPQYYYLRRFLQTFSSHSEFLEDLSSVFYIEIFQLFLNLQFLS